MKSNRHVPIIYGVVFLAGGLFFIFYFSGWWKYLPAALFLFIGWGSLKTGWVASDQEIHELTGEAPMSEETERKLRERL
jgi:hypothetical protein